MLLGALVTMPLALPVLIVLGKGLIAIQLDINYQSFIFLLLGIWTESNARTGSRK